MPRMRGLSDAVFYRPAKSIRYQHFDALLGGEIDWDLIATRMPPRHDPGRAGDRPSRRGHAIDAAAKAWHIQPSQPIVPRIPRTRPRRAHAVLAALHLKRGYPSCTHPRRDHENRRLNDFLDWVSFGGPVIKSGDPVEQEKQLKYASLVANAIMLSNVADLTEALAAMAEDGQPVTSGLVACLSPYMREHIRRFGQHVLDMDRLPGPLNPQPLPFEVPL